MIRILYKKGVDLDDTSMIWVFAIFACLSLLTLSPAWDIGSFHIYFAQIVIASGVLCLFCARKYRWPPIVSHSTVLLVCTYCVPITLVYNYDLSAYNEMRFTDLCVGLGFCFVLLDWRVALVVTLGGSYLSWIVIHAITIETHASHALPSGAISTLFTVVVSGATLSAFLASQLKSRNKRAKMSVGVLAHEMRTPLSAIGMMTKTLKEETPAGSHPNSLAKKMDEIIESMQTRLDLQSMNVKGRSQMENPPMDLLPLGPTIQSAVERYFVDRPHLCSAVIISIEEPITIKFNEDLFRSVIQNLLSNAVKAVDRKKRGEDMSTGDIIITAELDGNIAIIEVTDKGDGINKKLHKKIFKEFFTLSNLPANGLGLTMVKGSVEGAGGSISVLSEEGNGTHFTIRVPGRKA